MLVMDIVTALQLAIPLYIIVPHYRLYAAFDHFLLYCMQVITLRVLSTVDGVLFPSQNFGREDCPYVSEFQSFRVLG